MKRANPSKAAKRHKRAVARKGISEKRYGGNEAGKQGEMTVGKLRRAYFGGDMWHMSIPDKHSESNVSKKTNRNQFSVKAKNKKRLKKNTRHGK